MLRSRAGNREYKWRMFSLIAKDNNEYHVNKINRYPALIWDPLHEVHLAISIQRYNFVQQHDFKPISRSINIFVWKRKSLKTSYKPLNSYISRICYVLECRNKFICRYQLENNFQFHLLHTFCTH